MSSASDMRGRRSESCCVAIFSGGASKGGYLMGGSPLFVSVDSSIVISDKNQPLRQKVSSKSGFPFGESDGVMEG